MLSGRTSVMNPKGLFFPNPSQSPTLTKRASYEEADQEKFILEVKKRECLWNNKVKIPYLNSHEKREVKRKAWEEIGRTCHDNWDDLTHEERYKKVETLTKRWRNIRKYYLDELRRPSDSPAKKKQRRRYHRLLTFLDDTNYKGRSPNRTSKNEMKTTQPNTANDSSSDSESNELHIIEDVKELEKLSNKYGPIPDFYTHTDADPTSFDYQEPVKPWQIWDAPLDLAKPNVDRANTETEARNPELTKLLNVTQRLPNTSITRLNDVRPDNDVHSNLNTTLDLNAEACRQFLLSFVPELMSLDVKQYLQFRLGMLDLLNDIKFRVNSDDDNQ